MGRRRVRAIQMSMGRSGGFGLSGNFGQMMSSNGEIIQDYNNDKVMVSISKFDPLISLQQIRQELGEFDYDEAPN